MISPAITIDDLRVFGVRLDGDVLRIDCYGGRYRDHGAVAAPFTLVATAATVTDHDAWQAVADAGAAVRCDLEPDGTVALTGPGVRLVR